MYIKRLVKEFTHVFLGGGVIVITITILLSQMSNYKIWLYIGPPKSRYILKSRNATIICTLVTVQYIKKLKSVMNIVLCKSFITSLLIFER